MPTAPPRTPGLPFVFVTLALDMIGLGIVIPVVPALVGRFAGDPGAAAHWVGILIALFSGAQLLTAPALGALSDRVGRRPVLLVSTLLTAVAYALAALAPTLGWFLLARTLGGIGGATVGVANAYIADVSAPQDRARNFGLAGAAFGLGLIVGPAFGGLLGTVDLRLPFAVSAAFAALNFLYGLLILPESRRGPPGARDALGWVPLRALAVLGRFPGLPMLAAVSVCVLVAQQFLTSTWVLHGTVRYGWTPGTNGSSLALAGILSALVQVLLLPRVLRRLGTERTVLIGLLLGVAGNLLYGLAAQGWMLLAFMPFATLSGVAVPALQGIVAAQVPPEAQGAVQGALSGLGSLCAVVAPLGATALFAHFTAPASAHPLPGIAFFVSAGFLLLGLGLFRTIIARPAIHGAPA